MSTPARILMVEGDTVPPVPTNGQILFYAKTSGTFYSLNSAGVETPLGGGSGGVTSVAATGTQGVSVSGSPITSTGTFTIGLGAITPTSVAASGAVTGSNISGTNTGDQSITLTGDATNSSTSTGGVLTLATVNSNTGTFGSATQVPVFTVDAKGRITSVTNTTITGGGTVTSVGISGANGIDVASSPITTSGTIALSLGAITPTSVSAAGTVTGSNLSGTNTGDQSITLTGDATNSSTSTGGVLTLTSTGVTAATYGSSTQVPVFTVDAKGRISSVTNTAIALPSAAGTVTGAVQLRSAGGTFTASDVFFLTGTSTLNLGNSTNIGQLVSTGALEIDNEATNFDLTLRSGDSLDLFANSPGSFLRLYTDGSARLTINQAGAVAYNSSFGSVGQVLTSQGSASPPTWTTPSVASGTVTTVSVTTANGVSGSVATPTTTPAITLTLGAITPTSVAATGTVTGSNLSGVNTGNQTITLTGDVTGSGTGTFAATLANTSVTPGSYTNSNVTVDSKGRITSISNGTGGSGTVTSASVTTTADISGTVATPTTTPALSLSLTTTGVSASTYGSATQVPVFAVDSKGRITSVTNTTITAGSNSPEIVVWNYSSGGAGNFTPVDAIFSQTSGVTATVTDGVNCIATYAFTGKSNPPKSITTYGQTYATNNFTIKDTTSLPSAIVAGGGTAAAPDLRTVFTASNIVTLQTRLGDVGAAAGLGQRAWLIVVFGF